MQMSIYNRKHWHALSHSLHFVRHEGRLATIGRTRLTRSMAANEPGFLYTVCGTSSSSYSRMCSGWPARWSLLLVHLLVLRMTAGPKPTLQLLRFCVSLISAPLFGRFSFFQVYGVVEVFIYEVSVRILFASCDGQSIVCPCKLNHGRQYCQFVFKRCEVGAIQDCSTFRVLPQTLSLNVFAFGNIYLSRLWGSKHAVFFISFVGCKPVRRQVCTFFCLCCSKLGVFESRLCGSKLVVLLPVWL